MLRINENKITVNGIETRNPELIGLAVLDMVSSGGLCDSQIRELRDKFYSYVVGKGQKKTTERKKMINILLRMEKPNKPEFITEVMSLGITQATAYNFINLCKEAGIIEVVPEQMHFNVNLVL